MARLISVLVLLAAGIPLAGCRAVPLSTIHVGCGPSESQAGKSRLSSIQRPSSASNQQAIESSAGELAAEEEITLASEEVELAPTPEVGSKQSELSEPIRLSVRDAIETALIQNPDLVAQRAAEDVSVAALSVARTYPFNPFLQVQATPLQDNPNRGPDTTHHYVLLMQQLQLAHQQSYREQGAGAQLDSVRWTILQQQLMTVAQTERLYFTALYLRGLRDLASATAKNNQQMLTVLERQLDAGAATAADVAMVRLDARSTRQQLRLAEAQYQTALLDLRRQLGLPKETPVELNSLLTTGETTEASLPPSPLESLSWLQLDDENSALSVLVAGRPDVMAALADLNSARANASLANANRIPDVQIGPYYQRTTDGTYFLGFRGQMDIPVLNSGQPLLRQREAELNQRTTMWRQLQTRATLEAEAAIDRYERARETLAEVDPSTAAEFPVELQRLEEQFQAGEVDVLRVFQARNSLIQNRRAVLDSLNELYQSAANVTAATGLPLEAFVSTANSRSK